MSRVAHATGARRRIDHPNHCARLWAGPLLLLTLVLVPALANAQTGGHAMHMPAMEMSASRDHAEAQPRPEPPAPAHGMSRTDADCIDRSHSTGGDVAEPTAATCSETKATPPAPMPTPVDHQHAGGMDHGHGSQAMPHRATAPDTMQMDGMAAPAGSTEGARDPDYSDGVAAGPMPGMDMADDATLLHVLLDTLEYRFGDGGAQAVDAQAWYGGDRDKLWLKLDGEREDGRQAELRTELLWNRAIATYWGLQAGVRHDRGEGPNRDWAAFGVQGLAPYWFDIEATAYVGQSGRTAVRLEVEREFRFTQRLILQPDVEVDLYGKDDPARGIGAGLSRAEAALRLRYEVTRKFAPYVGMVWSGAFGRTADYNRATGNASHDARLVAGIRIWF